MATTGKTEKQALQHFTILAEFFTPEKMQMEIDHPGASRQPLMALGWVNKEKRWTPPPELLD